MRTTGDVTTTIETELGALRLVAREGALIGVYFPEHHPAPALGRGAVESPDDPVLRQAARQLADYFAGARLELDLPIALEGTAFQREVWSALRAIPYGTCVGYAAIAARIGRPRAVRAVGAANGRNPLSIVVPCHRVIGSDGALTGYAGGLSRKRWLLALEARARAACA
ncbi:MAG: methylated-DNA--[protein]-cysteine S-methyltransferase [Myxococcota bacterium]|nr:methylated-DNA--[protein]-cysteine S-methyltransferase [Myxococcota bacterium]